MTDSPSQVASPLNPSSPTMASISPVDRVKSTKADYGWLAAIMAQWIEDLNKRYPAMLRTEGVEGKVTLAATLHENGRLSDVRVVKSSGSTALDQVAVEDVRNGPPIDLAYPLGRDQIPVKFSISYDLKTAR
ncbi:MAG: energy transducer TonB [Nitrospira sp.]|nr:energy transducer TonB [Nitrospira sp.]MDR4463081.1 TonB family protein [Nitrospira sp.]